MKTFFANAETHQLLLKAKLTLGSVPNQPRKWALLEQTLGIIDSNAADLDAHCQRNIEWIGSSVLSGLQEFGGDTDKLRDRIDALYGQLYRFLREYDLSVTGDLSPELRTFLQYPQEDSSTFSDVAKRQMEYADRSMPISIMKALLGTEVLQNVQSVKAYTDKVNATFAGWEKTLKEREDRAETLSNALKKYETAFNFVGLYQGFNNLSQSKKIELWVQRLVLVFLGLMTLVPLFAEIWFIVNYFSIVEQMKWPLLVSAVPALSLTVILVYFFRLAVRSVDSTKSQLLQIELRKTLCQFIQDYADYAKKIREGGDDVLSKFENVVFSGIVGNDEKIPATFDGLEQLSKLIKTVKG